MSGSTSNTIGSGSDTISLKMSEDQAQGVDAQFTLNVDGQQIGGPQSVSASHAAGQDETFNFAGNYAPGTHTVTVTFANNFLLPGTSGDRNLFVDGVSYDGQTVSSTSKGIFEGPFYTPNNPGGTNYGNAVYSVNDTTAAPAGASSAASTTPGAVSAGSGPDTLVLNMSEDPYQGDAQFTVSVDGKPVGGTLTTTAITNQGQQQEFDIHGSFGSGSHTVSVAFVNDHINGFYAGTTDAVDTTDRNLYIMGLSLNGGPQAGGAPWEQGENGSHNFTVTAGSNQSAGSATAASAPSSDTATVTTDSLTSGQTTAGSSSGMSFVAAPATTTDTSATTPAASTTATPTPTTTDTTASAGSAIAGATQTAADYTIPSTTDSSGTSTTSSSGSTGHHWWMDHQDGNWSGWAAHHQA
jgi:hypothetical protein